MIALTSSKVSMFLLPKSRKLRVFSSMLRSKRYTYLCYFISSLLFLNNGHSLFSLLSHIFCKKWRCYYFMTVTDYSFCCWYIISWGMLLMTWSQFFLCYQKPNWNVFDLRNSYNFIFSSRFHCQCMVRAFGIWFW